MKRTKNSMTRVLLLMPLLATVFLSCKYDVVDLKPKPTASFTATPLAGAPNKYVLTSTSQNAWRFDWDKAAGSGYTQGKEIDTVYFPYMGNYTVKLFVYGQSGVDSASKVITVAANDPTACVGTQLGFITGCTQKKWKLDPAAAAYKVGPGPNDGSWWSSGLGDVTGRSCEFNDEYTFVFSAARTFTYDNKGDFYGDGYLGDNSHTCQPSANYTAAQAPWGSGSFTYTFTANAGAAGLGQLTVVGLGAHIGLQKVRNGSEVTSGPATSITYDVLAATHDVPGNYDVLTLGVAIGAPGWWTFRLRSF
jgi:PKD repeat protein